MIDTNVLVSALYSQNPDTAPFQLLDNLFKGRLIPMYNAEIIAEYKEVLSRPKFPFAQEDIQSVIDAIIHCGIMAERIWADEILPDPKDVVFYEVAMSRDDSYLVTGNIKHFPKVWRVVTPRELLDIILGG